MNRENKRKQYEKGYYKHHPCSDHFICRKCGRLVVSAGAGSGHRNHCPNCLTSLHLDVEPGDKVELEAICVVDGDKVEADPAKAAKTKVVATVLEQFKGDKQLVFKFKKRKNYKKLRGHRQNLTRVKIESVGTAKAE